MKLKIIGGELEVEFGSILEEAKRQLQEAAKEDTKKITGASDVSEPTKSGMGKLDKKPKISI